MERQIHVIVLILLSIFEVWMCYQVLYRTVLEKKYLRNWKKVLIWGNILGVGLLLGVNRSMFFFSSLMSASCLLITIVVVLAINGKPKWLVFEITAIYFLLVALSDFFFSFCGMTFIDGFYHIFYNYNLSIEKCTVFLISRISILLIFWLLVKHNFERILQKTIQCFLIITVIGLTIIMILYQILVYDIWHGMSDVKGWSAACSLFTILTGFIFCVVICWKNQRLRQENQILEMREKMDLKNLKEISEALEKNKIQIHDLRHHITILREYVTKQEYGLLKEYLNQLLVNYAEIKEKEWTGIKNIDILLNENMKKAEIKEIKFQIEVDILRYVPFTETEGSVLFGNLLSNAVEACEKIDNEEKCILVKIKKKKTFLFIEITNTFVSIPQERDGELITDKKNSNIHGYGMKSIKRIVKKYDGFIECQVKEKKYSVHICFYN